MAVSDSLALSSPYIAPPVDPKRERLRERRADLRPCPECGTEAEFEPTCITIKGGKHLRVTVIRCPQCGTLTRSEEIPTPITREEPAPMSTLCACGCGEVPKNKRRFASCACSNRFNAAKRREQKSYPPPTDFSCQERSQLGTSDEFAPGPGGLSPSGVGTPLANVEHAQPRQQHNEDLYQSVRTSDPSPIASVKGYLSTLSREARLALLELVDAEQRFRELGGRL